MSWIRNLYETYNNYLGKEPSGSNPLMPVSHTVQQAHIEVVVDIEGEFIGASLIQKENTVIPATEKSAGRTSGESAHPLCDKIQYCAGDYSKSGGKKSAYFDGYLKQLKAWCTSPQQHPKAKAVLAYVEKRRLVSDLVGKGVLAAVNDTLVVNEKKGKGGDENTSGIFKLLTPKKEGASSFQDQGDAFVRWRVGTLGDVCTGTWEDQSLIKFWQDFDENQRQEKGLCMVLGIETVLAGQHPARLRHGADKAKLISSNDMSGFTFRGRFDGPEQAAGVSFDVTQKAHSALRWLIERKQAFRNGDQIFISWAINGKPIPNPLLNSFELLFGGAEGSDPVENSVVGDAGQSFSLRLNSTLSGYKSDISDSDDIIIMGLDSATPGRMAITLYREIKGSDFLNRVEAWHSLNAWPQNFGKNKKFTGTPSPRDIAEAAYGQRLDDNLKKATVGRLFPCILDGTQIPHDLVNSCIKRSFNRVGMENWEWEKCLGIACSLYKNSHQERKYQMGLEEDRKTRDYLYGRLLAIAEHLENRALYIAGEKNRDTTAARLMQRFADRPFATWKTIELSLSPYKSRLQTSRGGGFLNKMQKLLDSLMGSFTVGTFTNDSPLSGEFLLGYHCQRGDFDKESPESEDKNTEENKPE